MSTSTLGRRREPIDCMTPSTLDSREESPEPLERVVPEFYYRNVLWLAVAFLGVFGGFIPAQGLQSSLNATLGFINSACCYAASTVSCLLAPKLLSRIEASISFPCIMCLSAIPYVLMIVSNMYADSWALPIAMNTLVGTTGILLWTCQNVYVARCAHHATKQQRFEGAPMVADQSESTAAALAENTAKFNSIFFSVYQFSGSSGNFLASGLMLAFSGKHWLRQILFLVLGGIAALGVVAFLSLSKVPAADEQEQQQSVMATGRLVSRDARMRLLVPLIFTNGMTLAFVWGDFPTDITCPVAGSSFVGFVAGTDRKSVV